MVTCKRCEAEVSEDESRPVGTWRFCVPCFDAVMSGADKKPAAEEASEEAEAPAMPKVRLGINMAVDTAPTCSTCGKRLAAQGFKSLGGMRICEDCYGGMAQERWQAKDEEGEEAAAPEDDGVPVVHPGLRKLRCAGCNKRVPEGGAKRIFENPYCPDCYSALKEATEAVETFDDNIESSITRRLAAIDRALADAGVVEAEPQVAVRAARPAPPAPAPAAAGLAVCAACQLPTPAESLTEVSGFLLCPACRNTDLELALDVARKRHLLWLKRQARELEEV